MYVPLAAAQNKRAVTAWHRNPTSCKLHWLTCQRKYADNMVTISIDYK